MNEDLSESPDVNEEISENSELIPAEKPKDEPKVEG